MVNVECLEDLANAVVERAARDYRLAVEKHDAIVKEEVESFFLGDEIKRYTRVNGRMILEALQNESAEERRRHIYDGKNT